VCLDLQLLGARVLLLCFCGVLFSFCLCWLLLQLLYSQFRSSLVKKSVSCCRVVWYRLLLHSSVIFDGVQYDFILSVCLLFPLRPPNSLLFCVSYVMRVHYTFISACFFSPGPLWISVACFPLSIYAHSPCRLACFPTIFLGYDFSVQCLILLACHLLTAHLLLMGVCLSLMRRVLHCH
jgi:hypothetical protein